jgi:putative transcriptional regulator
MPPALVGPSGTVSRECHTDVVASDGWAFLAGRLLVAAPQIEEETFRRSVVLLLHHDEEGAQGVILNRPLEADIDAVLPGWKSVASTPKTVFQGGPVELNSAIGLVTVPGDEPEPLGIKHLFGGLGLVDLDAPPNLVAPEVAGMRIFAGYAGWSGGQLEHEILRGDWYVVDSESRDAFSVAPERLWSDVLLRQKDSLKLVASYPDDPTLN